VRYFNYRSIIGLFPPALLDLVGTSHSGVRTSFKAQIQLHIDSRNYDTFSLTVEHQKCPPPLKETTTKGADEAQFAYEHAFILFTQHPSYGEDWDPSQRVSNFLNIFLMGFVLFWVLKYLPWPSSGWWSWSDVMWVSKKTRKVTLKCRHKEFGQEDHTDFMSLFPLMFPN